MTRFIATILLLVLVTVAGAQDDQNRDDRSYLTALLEDNLSGAGRDIRIIGFSGALSSRASIQELTIADEDGIWLVLKDVVLNWNRAALLRGRLEVNELTAGVIELPRFPVSEPSGPSAQARDFKFPDLPVSVDIARIRADRVLLGAPVLGRAVQVKLDGSFVLDDGSGNAKLSIIRTDGARGSLKLDATFDGTKGELSVDLSLSEEKNGITAELLGLPGRPGVEMTIAGTGPLADYSADITLATAGQNRLSGRVSLTHQDDIRQVQARINGDIAPLFAPDYREFFGPKVALSFSGWRDAEGAMRLEELTLETASLNLTGTGSIGTNGWPERFSVSAIIRDNDGSSVLLPLSAVQTRVSSAKFDLEYDESNSDGWTGRLLATEFESENLGINLLELTGGGQIGHAGTTSIGGATGVFKFEVTDIKPVDPKIARALGQEMNGSARFDWQQGKPVTIEEMVFSGDDFDLSGKATLSGFSQDLEIDGHILVDTGELARFSGLAGTELGGAGKLDIAGQYAPLGGAFDLTLAAKTLDLKTGQTEIDKLLGGSGELNIEIARDTNGTTLRMFDLVMPEINASVLGKISSEDGSLVGKVRLTNLGVFVAGLNGPVTLEGTASQHGANWDLTLNGNGPVATKLSINGTVSGDGGHADVRATGTTSLALANPFIKPRSLAGAAIFDVSLSGPLALSSVSGNINASNGRMASPDLRLSFTDLTMSAAINGGQAAVNLAGGISSGGQFSVTGPVSLLALNNASLSVDLQNLRLVDPELYETVLGGIIALEGPLAGGARISGGLTLARTEISVPSTGFSEIGSLPGLVHVNEPADVRATRSRSGLLLRQSGTGIAGPVYLLDLAINAPERIFVRGRGLDAELGGQLRLGGSTTNVQPAGRFELIRGRLDILGERLNLTEGMVQMRGDFIPYIRFVATTSADAATITVTVEGKADNPAVTFSSQPELPEDEVLSQMLFNRSITQISPFQAAQLAAAVATLAGKGGGGIISGLREDFGLDDLDITTSETGSTGVRLGKYISDNIYTDIEIDSDGTSQINLNLQLSPSLVVKGGAGSDGNTGIGVFFEKDY